MEIGINIRVSGLIANSWPAFLVLKVRDSFLVHIVGKPWSMKQRDPLHCQPEKQHLLVAAAKDIALTTLRSAGVGIALVVVDLQLGKYLKSSDRSSMSKPVDTFFHEVYVYDTKTDGSPDIGRMS